MKNILMFLTSVLLLFALTITSVKGNNQNIVENVPYTDESAININRTDYTNEEAGLINPYIVGIDQERFDNEVLYPVPKDAHEIKVESPTNVFDDMTVKVERALLEAKEYQKTHNDADVVITLPSGKICFYQNSYDQSLSGYDEDEYIFEDGANGRFAIFLHDMKNISIQGQDDTEVVLFGENGFYFIRIIRCENVHLVNFSIDYGKIPFYFGEVTEVVNNKTYRIRTFADYPVTDTNIECYIEYDKDTGCMRESANNTYNASGQLDIESCTLINGDPHHVELKFAKKKNGTEVGTKVALSTVKTNGNTFVVTNTKNIYFESINVYCGAGSSLIARCNENIYMNRLNAKLKPNTDRLLSFAGDFIHVEDTKGDFILTNSLIENTQDDGINVASHYMFPYGVYNDTNSVALLYRGSPNDTYCPNDGDVLAMMDRTTLRVVGYYEVESSTFANSHYLVTMKKGGTATLPSGETVELESDLSKVGSQADSIFSNITRTPNVLVENVIVRNKRNRGLLIQSRNVTVRNCEFYHIDNTALLFLAEMASFCESTVPKDVLIENCKFIDNDDNDIQIAAYNVNTSVGDAGAIENVTIKNNLFAYQQNDYSLYITSTKNLKIIGNWFYKPQTGTDKVGYATDAIMFRNISELVFDKNRLDKFLESRGGISVWGDIDIDTITWGDNIGFDRADIFGNEEAETIKVSNQTVVIDGAITDWAGINATDIAINNVTNVHIQKLEYSDMPEGDFSATVKVFVKISESGEFAADDGIYFYFVVNDDIVEFQRSQWWTGDCFEFFLSSDLTSFSDIGAIRNDDGVETLQIALKGDSEGNCSPNIYPGRTSDSILNKVEYSTANSNAEYVSGDMKFGFALTKKGYRGEVFIPFSLLPICGEKLRSGEAIAMTFCFCDCTEIQENEVWAESTTFANIPHPTNTNNKVPATMSKFKLEEEEEQ